MPENSRFRTPAVNEPVHGSQTLTNCAWRNFYPNFQLIQDKIELEDISLSHI